MKLPEHLFPFQVDAAIDLAEHRNRILGLKPGAGKSVISIATWEELGAMRILVVCPSIMVADWREKVLLFAQQNYTIGRMPGLGRTVVVRSYESLNSPSRRNELLATMPLFDLIILDEGQRLRNLGSAITTSIYGTLASGKGLVARAKRVWPLSGTIAVNHIGDIYPHVHALAPELLPKQNGTPFTQQQFMHYFAVTQKGRWGDRVVGYKNKEELKGIVRGFVTQCDPKLVDEQLPPIMTAMKLLPSSELNQSAYNELAATRGAQELGRGIEMADVWELTESISEARRMLGELKAAAVARYVREVLEDEPDSSILIFGFHRLVMAMICADLRDIDPHVQVIDGDVPDELRQIRIASLQAGKARVLIAGIGTMREGVTLTRANRVIFAEASWVPAENEQAVARAYRIGQDRPVLVEYVCIADTLDESLMRVCARKSKQLSELF